MNMAAIGAKCNSVRWAFNFGSWNPTESQILIASSCLQSEEKEQIARFVFRKDAKASLIGRLLLRKCVSDFSRLPYSAVTFSRDERGKPYLLNKELGSALSFNVSHQGSYTVLAGEAEKTVGVDVMKQEYTGGRSVAEFFRLMTRHFSPEEWVTINGYYGTSDKEKIAMFYRHWCLKESYVKATGTGITVDLQDISFRIATKALATDSVVTDTRLFVRGEELRSWCFEECLLDSEHCVAVALRDPSPAKENGEKTIFTFLSFDEVVRGYQPLQPPDSVFCKNFLNKEERPS